MNELFLSFVWKYRLYRTPLLTTAGEPVQVIKPGEQQSNAGPDFFNAQIRIGDTLWAGNVEIHVRSTDWYRHGHQHDGAYNNVILHVVHEADSEIIVGDMTTVPTVALADQTEPGVWKRYHALRASREEIPCARHFSSLDSLTINNWMDRMITHRLEHKSMLIETALQVSRGDWEEAFYQLTARSFGFNVNAVPFEMLSRCLPRNLLLRHADQPHQAEALVYGQAGFLEENFSDDYPRLLKEEYRFLSRKYGLLPMEKHLWKLLRMRPANFPTIRLSQFTSLVTSQNLTFSGLLDASFPGDFSALSEITASPYWYHHYLFDRPTRYSDRTLGKNSVDYLVINTVAPVMFYYGKTRNEQVICDRAFEVLRKTRAETNHVTGYWKKLGLPVPDAYTSQACIGLFNDFCSQKKCLNCSLGTKILTRNESTG
jgi:hypothetical protein